MTHKVTIKSDHELSNTGVTRIWSWSCSHPRCDGFGEALFWENALKIAIGHSQRLSRD